jgi:eukaryotic-like serine/threonine-protein kinase
MTVDPPTGSPDGPGGSAPPAAPPDARSWHRVSALFEEIVERDPAEWPERVAAAPETDRALLARLLAADAAEAQLLDRSPVLLADELMAPDDEPASEEPHPVRIGRYRVVRPLGRGGMGQVLLARRDDGVYAQTVAVKLVRRGMDSEDVLRRFRAERQILANLAHPNIATLLDGGITSDGRPYFVLEYVPGLPITEHCEVEGLPSEDRLRLFVAVCEAVQHAHDRGVVHRDLKPSNILVAVPESGGPATAKLLDFGIARLLEPGEMGLPAARTATGLRFLTPDYASPEQLRGDPAGPASDVYSLGVVLQELLTGRRHVNPTGEVCADTRGRHLDAALRAVVRMAMRPEPERRYASPRELGDDVRRFLEGHAVRARGDSISYRVGSFVRRRTTALSLAVAALSLMTTAGVSVSVWRGATLSATAPVAAAPLSLALLPFEYAGPEGQEYLADGLADGLNQRLVRLAGLTVVPPGTIRLPGRTSAELGVVLGVGYVLEGSVLFEQPAESSGRVIVSSRLIRVHDGAVVWRRIFDQSMASMDAMESAIAREVKQALRLAGDTEAIPAGTSDLAAHHFFLRGKSFHRFDEDEERLRIAEASYRQALANDSTFAQAWAMLSTVHTGLWFHRFDPSDERLEMARDAAERALRLHPALAESYYALGMYVYQGRGDLHQARRYFERALELQPNHIQGLRGLALVLRRQGRLQEALGYFEELTVLDPLNAGNVESLAFTHTLLRNYAEAERLFSATFQSAPETPRLFPLWAWMRLSRTGSVEDARQMLAQAPSTVMAGDFARTVAAKLELMAGRDRDLLLQAAAWDTEVLDSQPWYLPVAWLRARAYAGLGMPDSARAEARRALHHLGERIRREPLDARAHGTLGLVQASLGMHDEAVRSAQRGVELIPHGRDAVLAPFRVEELATVYRMAGRHDEAVATLHSLLAMPGLISARRLHADPAWAPLRRHPGFPAP